jgi:uncharacterized protein YndB with AHSA1/START domain
MKTFDVSITIQRPVEEVFAAIVDFNSHAEWRTDLIDATLTSEGPIQPGTTYRYDTKVMGRVIETVGEIESYDPPHFYAWKATASPFPMSGSMKCEPVPGGTLVTDTIEADPGGFFKLAEPLLMRQQRNQMEKDIQQLKIFLENGSS